MKRDELKRFEIFNWYILNGNICGDICLKKFRHIDYINSKLKNKDNKIISKNDFLIKNKLIKYFQYYVWVYGHSPFNEKEEFDKNNIKKDSTYIIGMSNDKIINILNNDKDFQVYLIEKNVERFMKFVSLPITKIIKTTKEFIITTKIKKIINQQFFEEEIEFILINMDNFYLKNKKRSKDQLNILETFKFVEYTGLDIFC